MNTNTTVNNGPIFITGSSTGGAVRVSGSGSVIIPFISKPVTPSCRFEGGLPPGCGPLPDDCSVDVLIQGPLRHPRYFLELRWDISSPERTIVWECKLK